jgi:MSHA pilin protein MshC
MQYLLTRRAKGYTLVEIIVVLVVMGILSIATMLRLDSVTQRDVINQADLLRRDLAHLQAIALSTGLALRLNGNSGSYTVTCLTVASGTPCMTAGATLIDPVSNSAFAVTLRPGVKLTVVNSVNVDAPTIDFDSVGRPFEAGVLLATNPARTFILTGAGETSKVTLQPITGFTEVVY